MDRHKLITKYINKSQRGIEIAPWHSPVAPKAAGWNCLSLDIFPTETLKTRAQNDENLTPEQIRNIEQVDIVGSAGDLEKLIFDRGELGSFDYIVSSHNFEHLPNPLKFLQACSKVLKPGGMLSMAIPDRRGTFDYFRPWSETADFIEAYFEDRAAPSCKQVFANFAANARYQGNIVSSQHSDPRGWEANRALREHFANYKKCHESKSMSPNDYVDAHCSVFTPSSFSLIMVELQYLGLSSFELVEVVATPGAEFFVHLRNFRGQHISIDEERFHQLRGHLMHAIVDEMSFNSAYSFGLRGMINRLQRTKT
ncbi:class I SAM-dependent methyltransferase [Thiomonas sp.]